MPVLSDNAGRFYDVTKLPDESCSAECIHCRRTFPIGGITFIEPQRTLKELARALERVAGKHRCRRAA